MSEQDEIAEVKARYQHRRIMKGYGERQRRFKLMIVCIVIMAAIFVLAYVNG